MKISIIMVTYNAEKTIENSLLSLIKQDYKEKEIILIDGASTDRTMEIVKKYRDKITYLVSEPDNGIYFAMNKGISVAMGDFISFLSSGDFYVNNHVISETVKKILPETEVYFGNLFLQIDKKWRKWKSDKSLEKLYSRCSVGSPSSFVRKHIFEKFGSFDERYRCSGDYEFWLRLYTNHVKFQIGDQYMILMSDGGISSDPRKVAYKEDREIVKKYGVNPTVANLCYWKNMFRHTLVCFLRRAKLDNVVKMILGQPPLLTEKEMKEIGIDVVNPWFLDEISRGRDNI